MGYQDGFYVSANIAGYTGTLQDHPTVYFRNGDSYGRITQRHDLKENLGRSTVQSNAAYQIGNELFRGATRCIERVGPGDANILHVSRNQFITTMNAAQRFVLTQAIHRFQDQKPLDTMSNAERERVFAGAPIQGKEDGEVWDMVVGYTLAHNLPPP